MSIVTWFIIGIVVVAIIVYLVAIFNGLIRLNNNIKKSWANINVLLKQRHDELPKLINTVKGYMKYEKNVLQEITKARTEFMKAEDIHEKARISNQISDALKTIFAVAENYPKLQANESFKHLQNRISGLENEIADRREFYNDGVNAFNIRIQSIPDVVVAKMMGYTRQELFRVTAAEITEPEVEL